MLKKITRRVKNKFNRIFGNKHVSGIVAIKKLPNVNIHPLSNFSADTNFNLQNPAKFYVGNNAGCRKFCSFLVYPNASLIIKDGVSFNTSCSVNCLGYIEIGENTLIGESVKIYDHNHRHSYTEGKLIVEKEAFTIGKVIIGPNCWIGSNVTILNNVVIGENTIIGANCLIYKSIPANSIIKHREELIIIQQ